MDDDVLNSHMSFLTEAMTDLTWMSEFEVIDSAGHSGLNNSPEGVVTTAVDVNQPSTSTAEEFSLMGYGSVLPGQEIFPEIFALPQNAQQMLVSNHWQPPQQHSLPRKRSKYLLRRPETEARSITTPPFDPGYEGAQSFVMQRWQNSPPEDSGASLSAIYHASQSSLRSPPLYNNRTYPDETLSLGRISASSRGSTSSLRSDKSSRSVTSAKSQPTRRSKRSAKPRWTPKDGSASRKFKCTFCCDTFKHKFDWARHEKSLHLNTEEWQCTPYGGSVVLPITGRAHCAYCNILDPTVAHLEQHKHDACRRNDTTSRTFRRKDHLVQHLRLFHEVETLPMIDNWKVELRPIVSRCGFCDMTLKSWDERSDHLATHFRNGRTMADWRGDHGFEDDIASQVTYALAPYLIADDSRSLIPFSTTNAATIDHSEQIASQIDRSTELNAGLTNPHNPTPHAQGLPPQIGLARGTFADMLSLHLSQFAQLQIDNGIIPTDEMFQREARRVTFHDEDDAWNQTLADNPTWLRAFRQKHGLGG